EGCAPLDSAVTLAIALVIDPDAALRAPAAPVDPVPSAVAPAPPPVQAAPMAAPVLPPPSAPVLPPPSTPVANEATPPPPASRSDAASIALLGVVARGFLPSTSPGAALSADIALGRSLRASAGWLFVPEVRTDAGDFAFGMSAG